MRVQCDFAIVHKFRLNLLGLNAFVPFASMLKKNLKMACAICFCIRPEKYSRDTTDRRINAVRTF
jgi:hypothetical protein